MKLISMKDFVLGKQEEIYEDWEQNFKSDNVTYSEFLVDRFIDYAAFLNQPLSLGMFIPCDGLGNIINDNNITCQYDFEVTEQAKEKVLFVDFPLDAAKHHIEQKRNIEYLAQPFFNQPTLTESALKQIGINE